MMYGSLIGRSTSTIKIRRAVTVILGDRTKEERTIKLFKNLEWLLFYDKINVIKLCLVFDGRCPEY